ncbi:MAG TPA: flagellar basal body-associated FliL family protein [Rhodocyclaceae bacterium]|nr:flagellar basal body-associated FliL family protein [Rhodocyclaceae bacterium]
MSDAKHAADGAPKKGKGKLFLIIGIVVLVLVIGGAAAAFLLMKKSHSDDDGDDATAAHAEKKDAKKEKNKTPPVFVALDAFTVRLQTDTGDSYLQAVPQLRVQNNEIAEQVKTYTPELRHRGLLVIAAKKPTDVTTPAGVQQLSNELRVTFNNILLGKGSQPLPEQISDTAAPDDPVQEVLFTNFIVQ